jgi:hypothetical protein
MEIGLNVSKMGHVNIPIRINFIYHTMILVEVYNRSLLVEVY